MYIIGRGAKERTGLLPWFHPELNSRLDGLAQASMLTAGKFPFLAYDRGRDSPDEAFQTGYREHGQRKSRRATRPE